jgi:hypothetical protein
VYFKLRGKCLDVLCTLYIAEIDPWIFRHVRGRFRVNSVTGCHLVTREVHKSDWLVQAVDEWNWFIYIHRAREIMRASTGCVVEAGPKAAFQRSSFLSQPDQLLGVRVAHTHTHTSRGHSAQSYQTWHDVPAAVDSVHADQERGRGLFYGVSRQSSSRAWEGNPERIKVLARQWLF